MRSLKAQKNAEESARSTLTGSTRCIGSSGRTAGTSSRSQQPTKATDAHLSVIFFASQHCFLCSLVALRFPDKFVLNYSGNQSANISQPSMLGTMYQATGDLVNAAAFGSTQVFFCSNEQITQKGCAKDRKIEMSWTNWADDSTFDWVT